MAIYHLTAKIIGRKAGQSAVACAAYRSGQELDDARSGQTFRFSRADRVAHSEIALPDHAPAWARDRAALWNAVEAGERRKDAQLAREFELALPVEFDLEQQRELLRTWVSAEFTSAGAAADIAIHHDKAGRNPHAHIMTTMRALGPEGWSKQKLRQWEDRSALIGWRESWANHVNQALERAGRDERIDHRSYADQDVQHPENLRREPTRKVGPWAKGGERETQNRAIAHRNRERLDKLAALAKRLTAPVRQAVDIARRVAFASKSPPVQTPEMDELDRKIFGKAAQTPAPKVDRHPHVAVTRAAARARGPNNELVARRPSREPAPVEALRKVVRGLAETRDGRYDGEPAQTVPPTQAPKKSGGIPFSSLRSSAPQNEAKAPALDTNAAEKAKRDQQAEDAAIKAALAAKRAKGR